MEAEKILELEIGNVLLLSYHKVRAVRIRDINETIFLEINRNRYVITVSSCQKY